MASPNKITLNTGLPALPETSDPKLFIELVRVYNAINIIAHGIDSYTSEGTVAAQVTALQTSMATVLADLVTLDALRVAYYLYTVPSFTVIGAFGTNGKSAQTSHTLATATTTPAPAGGVGAAAGGWDTAVHRDTAIATINSLVTEVASLRAALVNNGIGV